MLPVAVAGPVPYTAREDLVYVYGIPFTHKRAAQLASRVITISSLLALCALISAILQLVSQINFSVGIFAAVIIPLCGWSGASCRSSFFVGFFVVANVVIALYFVISWIITVAAVGGDFVACACDPGCRGARIGWYDPAELSHMCDNQASTRALYWTGIGFGFLMAVLELAGCVYGILLLRTDYFDVIVESVIVPAGSVVSVPYGMQPDALGYYPGDGLGFQQGVVLAPPPLQPVGKAQQHSQVVYVQQ